MKENSYLEIKNYLEYLADKCVHIKDFVGFFQREWAKRTNDVKDKKLQSPAMVLFGYNLAFEGPEHNTLAVRTIQFAIVYNKVALGDFDAQYRAIHDAEAIAEILMARMKMDSYKENHLLYNSFIKDSVKIEALELDGGTFGVEVSFSIKNKQLLKVDKKDWEDIDKICG